jgi:hypothetical protein
MPQSGQGGDMEIKFSFLVRKAFNLMLQLRGGSYSDLRKMLWGDEQGPKLPIPLWYGFEFFDCIEALPVTHGPAIRLNVRQVKRTISFCLRGVRVAVFHFVGQRRGIEGPSPVYEIWALERFGYLTEFNGHSFKGGSSNWDAQNWIELEVPVTGYHGPAGYCTEE